MSLPLTGGGPGSPGGAATGAPVDLGNNSSVTSNNQLTLTTTAASPAGATILLGVVTDSGTLNWSSATDNAGNTYTLRADENLSAGSSRHVWIIGCDNANALPLGGVVTMIFSASGTTRRSASAVSVTDLGAFDVEVSGETTGTATTAWSAGPTAAMAQPVELALAFVMTTSTGTVATTAPAATVSSFLTGGGTALWAWRRYEAGGTATIAGTSSTTGHSVTQLCTFRAT